MKKRMWRTVIWCVLYFVVAAVSMGIFAGCSVEISSNGTDTTPRAAPNAPTVVPVNTPHPSFPQHKLLWADDFNGSVLDTSVWRYDTDATGNRQGWGNHELQWYTSSTKNAFIRDGSLVIAALHESAGGKAYTSARVHTHGGRSFQYGVIEAQIRMPSGSNGRPDRGIFPAFWMLGDNFSGWGHGSAYGGDTAWPLSGEIDVVEVLVNAGGFNKVYGTAHWHQTGACPYMSGANGHCFGPTVHETSSSTLYSEPHIYSIKWTPDSIEWYFDYKRYVTLDIRGSQYDEFRQPFFLLINLALGGLGGTPIASNYPQQMQIDWVRHYCPTDSSGACTSLTPTPPPMLNCPSSGTQKWIFGDCGESAGSIVPNLTRQHATDGTFSITPITMNGARGSSQALRLTRGAGGAYGGGGFRKSTDRENLSSFSNLTFSYRIPSGQPVSGFFVKVENGTPSDQKCNEHTLTGLTADGQWHEITVPVSALYGASNGGACNTTPTTDEVTVPFYLFITPNSSIDIDEIYYH